MNDLTQRFSTPFFRVMLALTLLTAGCESEETPQIQSLPVALQTVESATVTDSSIYVGNLEARQRVDLAPRIEGRILRILVEPGQVVARGQRLVELQPTQAQEDVREREGSLIEAQNELVEAQALLSEREASAASSRALVDEAQADVINAKAVLDLAEIDFKRAEELYEQDVVPRQTLDNATQELKSAQAQLTALEGTLRSRGQAFEASQKSVSAAIANIEAKRGRVISREGAKGSTQQTLQFNDIVAPINGVIGSFNQKKVGDFVSPGETITTLTDNRALDVNIGIPVEYRSQLREGLPVEIVNPNGQPGVQGNITYVAPLVQQDTQSILTKVRFINDGSLRDDQFVRVKVIWDRKPGILIPTTAIKSLGDQKFVYIAETPQDGDNVAANLVARERPVKLGIIQGQDYQVLSGIRTGEKVVTSRILDMTDGRAIVDESTQSTSTQSKGAVEQ